MSESKTFNVLRSSVAGLANGLILAILSLYSRQLFLTYIGLDYLSVAQVIANLLTVVSFSELGISGAILYMLYEPVASADENAVRRLLYLYRRFNRYVGLAVAGIGLLMLPTLPYFIDTAVPLSTVVIIYLLNLATSVSSYFYTYRAILLSATQRDYIASLISTAVAFVRMLVQCAVIYLTHDYLLFLLTGIFFTIMQNALIYFQVGRMYHYIRDISRISYDAELRERSRELWYNVKSMAAVKVAGIVINDTDNIIISWCNTLVVGLCANYLTVSTYLKSLVLLVQNILMHSIGISIVEKTSADSYRLFKKVLLINTWISGSALVGLAVSWNDFIVVWLGREYLLDTPIFMALVLNVAYFFGTATVWMFRDAAGLFTKVRAMLLFNAACNLILSVIAVNSYGIAGVYLATMFANTFTSLWFDARVIYQNIFQRSGYLRYCAFFLSNLGAAMALSVALNMMLEAFTPTVLVFIGKLTTGLVAYTLLFVLAYSRTEAFGEAVGMLRAAVNRKLAKRRKS